MSNIAELSIQGEDATKNVQKICANCKAPINLIVPRFEVLNAETVSMITFAHPESTKCGSCGQQYMFAIIGVPGLKFSFVPVQKKDENKIVIAPADMKIPRA